MTGRLGKPHPERCRIGEERWPAALLLPGRQQEARGNAGPRWMATTARAVQNPAYRVAVPPPSFSETPADAKRAFYCGATGSRRREASGPSWKILIKENSHSGQVSTMSDVRISSFSRLPALTL